MEEKSNDAGKLQAVVTVKAVPEEALHDLDANITAAGGELMEPAEYAGSIGRTLFDTPSSDDGTITVLLPAQRVKEVAHQSLVRIKSGIKSTDPRSYLGVVVSGPFAEPFALRADSPMLKTVAVQGVPMMPKYHGRVQVEIMGEEIDHGIVPPRRRPLPNSPVFLLSGEDTARLLRLEGDVRIGLADSHEDVEIRVPAQNLGESMGAGKSVWPRHVGYLGTTGGGKSTTVSGQIAQLQAVKFATILLDTEGEYTAINEPTNDKQMVQALQRRGLQPKGVDNTHVYHLVGRETRNPKHPSRHQFSLLFSELSPYAVMEILDLSDAQQERFLKAYDVTKLALERLGVFPANAQEKQQLLELDELESGYPRMKLSHLYDVIAFIHAYIADEEVEYLENKELNGKGRDVLKQVVSQAQVPKNVISWRAVLGKVGRIKRLKIFDVPGGTLPYAEMLQPGHVSIVDLSDTDSPQINNMVIAQLLRGLQQQQEANYTEAAKKNQAPTPAMLFIEEAHEFLSAQRIAQMPVLFQQVARIARRGRKRWLGLAFITQLPQHLPDEVLGLINNWVLHKISDAHVVARLRKSIGGIDDGLWNRLPALAPGQAVVSFTSMGRALQTAVDPTPCRLLLVD
jgi:DNA helicase HerA-like ATPase